MRPIVTHVVVWSVCHRSESVTIVNPAKMAEPTEMPFELWTEVGSRNNGVQIPMQRGDFERGKERHCKVRDSMP